MVEDDNQDNTREEFKAICYTPERLIRSQEYRILVPSPRPFIFSQARIRPENKSRERKFHRCQKQSDLLIDSEQIGTCLKSNNSLFLSFSFCLEPTEGSADRNTLVSWTGAPGEAGTWPDLIKFRGLPMRGIELLGVSDLLCFQRPRGSFIRLRKMPSSVRLQNSAAWHCCGRASILEVRLNWVYQDSSWRTLMEVALREQSCEFELDRCFPCQIWTQNY